MRNKLFPFFDELGRVFGKDRAAGNEAISTLDALEELEDEDKDRETPPSTTPSTNRTKKARTETIEVLKDFSTKIEKISGVMETASEHIGRLACCFQHESDSAEKRMQVTTEVMKIGQLTPTQVLLASKKIALNPLEVDFFFSLPDDYKYAYVQGLLIPEE
ncbi:hypothetical protein POM88_013673 [Heracleum sosnowskyi]|uniref:Uncharacterized protein n=1 Tax=Heracleum sosnowskyi TaxID=360622 RepID=A0AAD8J2B1_9APIA|nr:hypothetical protein POM88_013673 [Heracleum sosnowskyi]